MKDYTIKIPVAGHIVVFMSGGYSHMNEADIKEMVLGRVSRTFQARVSWRDPGIGFEDSEINVVKSFQQQNSEGTFITEIEVEEYDPF